MGNTLYITLKNIKWIRAHKKRMSVALLVLSLMVSFHVFWFLRQPGLTLAGDASCKVQEHTHDDTCGTKVCVCDCREEAHVHEDVCYEWILECGLDEHVHSMDCYCDETADVETMLNWQEMFADYPYTGDLRVDLVGIARTQVGYSESTRNYEVGSDGIRRGYTRYGAWYGTPYRNWSAMFVSFCLNYAGADPEENPGNTGANSMAELWNKLGKYALIGEYNPASGDLVFFRDNTVGIVAEIHNTTFQVIRGDVDDAVVAEVLALTDGSIAGWGSTEGTVHETEMLDHTEEATEDAMQEEQPASAADIDHETLLDISNGPVFFIFEGGETPPPVQRFSLRSSRTVTDLLDYLNANSGSYFFTLLDSNNEELPKDEQGNYIAQPNTGYKLTVSFKSPEGFLPGTYQYQVPNGLMVDGGEGTFILNDGTNVGSWVVTDTGLITLIFNENINSRTDITISATMGIHFPEQEEPIDFDGQITVTVQKPPEQQFPTELYKWGTQGGTANTNGTDPNKFYWTVQIIGHQDSQIPGNILSDQVIFGEWSKTHRYTESDIAGGLTFGVSENGNWHSWQVSPDDPHLIWTETSWSYKIPETVMCQSCGELELGNEGWTYYVNYTSTPDPVGTAGTFGYENTANIDGQDAYAWTDFTHGEILGEVLKRGFYTADAAGGGFLWEVQVTIPGRADGQKADYDWYIMDYMYLLDNGGSRAGYVENDAHLASVTAAYNGTTIQVPRVQDAAANDPFAWHLAWSASNDGISYGREIHFLSRCRCSADTCQFWNDGCGNYWFEKDDGTWATNGYCQCWTETENVTFTFVYETDDLSVVDNYGGLGYQLQNVAELYYKPKGSDTGALVSNADAAVTIPGLFKKELTHDFDGYTAHYQVTVNESKLVLTNGTPLYIHDVMTDTLAYISGSLVITSEDANGTVTTLRQGTDYTVAYDGTGSQMDAQGNEVHVLDIVILHPQPVMYILDYDATLIMPEQVTGGIKYSNSATITLWGEDITDSSTEKVHADINISAKSYKVEMFKTCAATNEPLSGAAFGLFNAQDGLIATDVTDAGGELLFQTSITDGIILREHILYYMQELEAPPGYQLDDRKYWFCFCDKNEDSCETCDQVMAGLDAVRIPFEQIGKVHAENQLVHYYLPATGGPGIYPFILVSVIFVVTPLVYEFIRRRKRERRGVG